MIIVDGMTCTPNGADFKTLFEYLRNRFHLISHVLTLTWHMIDNELSPILCNLSGSSIAHIAILAIIHDVKCTRLRTKLAK